LAQELKAKTEGHIQAQFIPYTFSASELSSYYRMSDLFWFASLKEGMGNVVAEALVYGTPVVTLPVDGIMKKLLIHPDDGEVVETLHPQEFAKTVNRWLYEKNIDRSIISKRAKSIFDPNVVENGYLMRLKECAVA
jgi:glycosyltransferase involved in cell wall biosynthesis